MEDIQVAAKEANPVASDAGDEGLAGFVAGIDADVEKAMAEVVSQQGDAADPAPEVDPPAGPPAEKVDELPAEPPAEATEPQDDPPAEEDGLSDDLIERAVKAGLSISEAKQYPNEALLSAVCGRIEGLSAGTGSRTGAGDEGPGEETPAKDDLLSMIPDLDPDEFDERIVDGFKNMKEIIRQQQETISGLEGGQSEDWVTTKLAGVKDFTKGDSEKEGAVRGKFDVLTAGYKAAGHEVSRETAFDEAARLVLGTDMEAAKASAKKQAAKKRSGQHIQRPSGSRVSAKADVDAEVADELNRKFFS